MPDQPTLYLIGGPNGAGKTTFAKEYLPNEVNCLRFYNSDEIAAGLSPLDPAAAQYQAGKILLKNLSASIAAHETFALESTLSGKTYAKYLQRAKENNFRIVLHYLWLPHPDESWARVQNRVVEGGHSVPKEAVYRRFPRISHNLLQFYIPLSDHWLVWDASQTPPEMIAEKGSHDIVSLLQ